MGDRKMQKGGGRTVEKRHKGLRDRKMHKEERRGRKTDKGGATGKKMNKGGRTVEKCTRGVGVENLLRGGGLIK